MSWRALSNEKSQRQLPLIPITWATNIPFTANEQLEHRLCQPHLSCRGHIETHMASPWHLISCTPNILRKGLGSWRPGLLHSHKISRGVSFAGIQWMKLDEVQDSSYTNYGFKINVTLNTCFLPAWERCLRKVLCLISAFTTLRGRCFYHVKLIA